ncbi:unnamed protein product [Moneuplotes crassus]|uniref:Uncharacterized protein n=1 Tax=Euplotes crassus TaxID=5936 RepID=A0AAD2D4W4_EUPCR|nr:unnamed protein product [Moneuplotes crassus]CAI2381254.1 unnamed protein product [Moneuplotes crassus]
MGKTKLYVSCRLENVDNLRLPGDDDWYFILQCGNCGMNTDTEVYFNPVEEIEMEGSRGSANYIAKCKSCERKGSISFIKTAPYLMKDNEEPQMIAEFECRGWELAEFCPKGGYICQSTESETVFDDVDLQEGDWAEYDDEGDVPVGIYDFKGYFE